MNIRRISKSLLFSLIIMFVILGIGEVFLHLAGWNMKVDNPFFMLVHVFEYPDYFEKDEQLFWRLRDNLDGDAEFMIPGFYRTNSLGLRGAEPPWGSLTDRLIIATFGNSCTFGWGQDEDESYPAILKQYLGERFGKDEVYVFNCGIPGYSSHQGRELMKRYLPIIKPDYVTIFYGWNDHWAGAFDLADKDQQMPKQFVLDIQNLASKSYLYRAVKWLLLSKYEKQKEDIFNRQAPVYRVSQEDYRTNLITMINLCREQEITPILITAPMGDADRKFARVKMYHEFYNDVVRSVAKEFEVPLVDAVAIFERQGGLFDDRSKDYIHFGARGSQFIASKLTELIGLAEKNSGQLKANVSN